MTSEDSLSSFVDRISTGCRAWLSRLENESENGKYKETL